MDLETTSTDVNLAEVRVFGMYDIDNDKFIITTDKIKALDIIQKAEFIIGYNTKEYDLPILFNRYKLIIPKDKSIDLYQIFLKRQSVITKKPFSNFKLKTIVKELELDDVGKLDIDYKIFQKTDWTLEEKQEIIKYLKQDLVLTAKCWEYLKKRFEPFKEFMNKKDVDNYKYINSSMGLYTYKAICNLCKIEEKCDFDTEHVEYEGAFVQTPRKEFVRGKVMCFDFASLYPMMYTHANLFSHHCTCCKPSERWDGGTDFQIKGTYCKKQQGIIEKLIKKLYLLRKEYKKNKDDREQVAKIILNCFSEDSEILTVDGIKKIKECKIGELVYSINPKTGLTEIKPIIDKIEKRYSGDMIYFKSKNVDNMVTPNHKVFYQDKNIIKSCEAFDGLKLNKKYPDTKPINGIITDIFSFEKYISKKDILNIKLDDPYFERNNHKHLIYNPNNRTHISPFLDKHLKGKWFIQGRKRDMMTSIELPINKFMYFLGIFVSEGSLYIQKDKRYANGNHRGIAHSINISQYKNVNPIIYNKIESTLKELGFRYYKNDHGFKICSTFLFRFLKQFGIGSNNKSLPKWLFKYDYTILNNLYDGLYDGDGNKRQNRYSTNSIKLRDDYMRLNLHLGYKTRYSFDSNCWRIARTRTPWFKSIRNSKVVKNITDKIVCVTVKDNHTIMAGRNGDFVWTGQSLYGVSGSPIFSSLYNLNTAQDCTALGRQCIKYAMSSFEKAGFIPLYGDTDSNFIEIPENKTEDECLNIAKDISYELSHKFPFPWEEFNMKLESKIKYIVWFLKPASKKGKPDEYKKKNYLNVTDDNKLTIKGLQIIKKDCSELSKHIFKTRIRDNIINELKCKYTKDEITNWIYEELRKNPELAAKQFSVRGKDNYKNETSIQAMIFSKYGEGEFKMIKNKRLGIGKGVKYCTVEEAKNLNIQEFDISIFLKELAPFIKSDKTTLGEFL